jgi:hypothetical protein
VIATILVLVYAASCLVAGRVVYTKYSRGEWFQDDSGENLFIALAGVAVLWPLALVTWLAYLFVTGGAKK